MPLSLRKLSDDEVRSAFPGRGQGQDLSEYVNALRGLQVGDAAELTDANASPRALKRRVNTAAKQLGLTLKFSRHAENGLQFMVQAPKDATRKRGPGRPRKNAS